jgi:hypothetical protein
MYRKDAASKRVLICTWAIIIEELQRVGLIAFDQVTRARSMIELVGRLLA